MTAYDQAAAELHRTRHREIGGPSCPRCERDVAIAMDALPSRAELIERLARLELAFEALRIANERLRAKLARDQAATS